MPKPTWDAGSYCAFGGSIGYFAIVSPSAVLLWSRALPLALGAELGAPPMLVITVMKGAGPLASRKGLVLPGAESSHVGVLSPACTISCSATYRVPGDLHFNPTPCLPRSPSTIPPRPPLIKISLPTKSDSTLSPRHGHPRHCSVPLSPLLTDTPLPTGQKPFLISGWLCL